MLIFAASCCTFSLLPAFSASTAPSAAKLGAYFLPHKCQHPCKILECQRGSADIGELKTSSNLCGSDCAKGQQETTLHPLLKTADEPKKTKGAGSNLQGPFLWESTKTAHGKCLWQHNPKIPSFSLPLGFVVTPSLQNQLHEH